MKLDYLQLHLGDELPSIGTGFRLVLVLSGTKNATILNPFTMRHATVPLEAKRAGRIVVKHGMDSLRSTPAEFDAARVFAIASSNRSFREQHEMFDGGEAARKVLDALKDAAAHGIHLPSWRGASKAKAAEGGPPEYQSTSKAVTNHRRSRRKNARRTLSISRGRGASRKRSRSKAIRDRAASAA